MNEALIIGASGGIGAALVAEFAKRDIAVTALSRSHDGLDVTDEASIQRSLAPLTGSYDWILVTTGGLEIGQPKQNLLFIRKFLRIVQRMTKGRIISSVDGGLCPALPLAAGLGLLLSRL